MLASRFPGEFLEIEERTLLLPPAPGRPAELQVASRNLSFAELGLGHEYSVYRAAAAADGAPVTLEIYAQIAGAPSLGWMLRATMSKVMVPLMQTGYAKTQAENHEFFVMRLVELKKDQ